MEPHKLLTEFFNSECFIVSVLSTEHLHSPVTVGEKVRTEGVRQTDYTPSVSVLWIKLPHWVAMSVLQLHMQSIIVLSTDNLPVVIFRQVNMLYI